MSKLNDVVKNDVVKRAVYEKLAAKVNNIDTSDFVLKTKYQTDIAELETKIPDVTDFFKKAKLTELENNIRDVSSLATKTALTTVKNEIPDVSSLVKKTDYNTKIIEIEKKLTDNDHGKYLTTPEFNTLAASAFYTRLPQANLITKTDFDAKLSSLNTKITANKSKHLLVENKLKKLKTFDLSYFIAKSHFEEHGRQSYLVFQPMYRYFKKNTGLDSANYIYYWKSKGLSDERINSIKTPDYGITPKSNDYGSKIRVEFNGSCLEQDKITYTHGKIVNIYIVYELNGYNSDDNDPTVKNSLFDAVTLSKNADIDKYQYLGYGTGFDRRESFSFPGGGFGSNVIIFRVGMSCSVHVDN